jgi:hypothetical protein
MADLPAIEAVADYPTRTAEAVKAAQGGAFWASWLPALRCAVAGMTAVGAMAR